MTAYLMIPSGPFAVLPMDEVGDEMVERHIAAGIHLRDERRRVTQAARPLEGSHQTEKGTAARRLLPCVVEAGQL
jgi:hypothetical protein